MSDNLPEGWGHATLSQLIPEDGVFIDGDWVESKDQDPNGDVRLIQLADIGDEKFIDKSSRFLTPNKAKELNCTFLQKDDVLLARMPDPLGRACLFPFESKQSFVTVVDVCVVRLNAETVSPKFLMYLINSPESRNNIEKYKTGSTRKRISRGNLAKIHFPIPPFSEQKRIVATIEELFSELDKGIESLKTVREQLKVYRQAVLKHAFEGKLTADWREENIGNLESGNNLRKKILHKRRKEWERSELENYKRKGKLPTNDKWKLRYKEPASLEINGLPRLPEEWQWVSLDEIVSGKARSMQSGPFGSNLKHSEFQQKGILVIGIDNVGDGLFLRGDQNRISEKKFKELEKYQARPGDLLITVMASLGRTCVLPKDLETAIITKHVYRITMEKEFLLPEFYNLLLQSETVSRKRMFENSLGQTRPGLNSSILKGLPLPLCDTKEQKEIVSRLQPILTQITATEVGIEAELQRSVSLRQSILKKAFLGKLVAQDLKDEPASVLLERIKAGKNENQKRKKKVA